jgi:hypothetical protein
MLTRYTTKWDAEFTLTTLIILWQSAAQCHTRVEDNKTWAREKGNTFYTNMNEIQIQVKLVGGPLDGAFGEWETESANDFPYYGGVCTYVREKDDEGTPKETAIYLQRIKHYDN